MPQPQTGSYDPSGVLPAPPHAQTGEEIYNAIMGKIEPELTLDQIPLLDEKYKNETDREKQDRLQRYRRAYEEYDKRYQRYLEEQKDQVYAYRKGLFAGVEARVRNDEEEDLRNIESALSTL